MIDDGRAIRNHLLLGKTDDGQTIRKPLRKDRRRSRKPLGKIDDGRAIRNHLGKIDDGHASCMVDDRRSDHPQALRQDANATRYYPIIHHTIWCNLHKISSLPTSMNITHNTYPPTIDNHTRQYVEGYYQLHDDIASQQGILTIKLNLTGQFPWGVTMMTTTMMTTAMKTIPSTAMLTTMTRRTITTPIIYIITSSRQFLAPSAPSVILRLCSETIYSSPHHGILFANISQQTSVTKAISPTSGCDLLSGRYAFQLSDCMNQCTSIRPSQKPLYMLHSHHWQPCLTSSLPIVTSAVSLDRLMSSSGISHLLHPRLEYACGPSWFSSFSYGP